MARRLTVGIPLTLQEHWPAGLLYVRNLVLALKLLPADERPHIVAIGTKAASQFLREETRYPGLGRVPARAIGPPRLGRLLRPLERNLDVVLLGGIAALASRAVQWLPDFQEEYLPDHFPEVELQARRKRNAAWLAHHRHVMVSSEASAADLRRFYGDNDCVVHVVPFATFLPAEQPAFETVRQRYGLPERYFICSNQFWRHKNHGLILRALSGLNPGESLPPIVLTGKEGDYRDPSYPASLRQLAAELGVESRIVFQGFLPRADQTTIMAGAVAVIQPSLFEGWSTALEDAKAVGRHVLASDIPVHREQALADVEFFNPRDPAALLALLRRYRDQDPAPRPIRYADDQQRFARRLGTLLAETSEDFQKRGVERLTYLPRLT